MKRSVIFLLLFALFLAGCTGETDALSPPSAVPASEVPRTPYYGDDLLEILTESGTSDAFGESGSWQYRLPQLISQSQEAAGINASIRALIPEPDVLPLYASIDYETHWNGSLISLILKFTAFSSGTPSCQVVNFDFETGKVLKNEDLAKRAGSPPEKLQQDLFFTVSSCFDRSFSWNSPALPQKFRELRAQTLGSENLEFSKAPLYLNDNGSLSGIFPIAVPEKSGVSLQALELVSPLSLTREVTDGYAVGKLQDGKLTVTFRSAPDSPWSQGQVPLDTPVPVDRLSGNYVDLTIGNLSTEFWPVLILLDENGMISFCSLTEYDGLTGSFHGIGPIACGQPVAAFSTMESQWGITVPCGLSDKGENIDFYRPIYDASATPSPSLPATVWTGAEGNFTARFPSDDPAMNMYWSHSGQELASGLLNFQGMDQNGLHYSYSLFDRNETVYGTLTLSFPEPGSGDFPWLTIRNNSSGALEGLPAESQALLFWEAP